MKIKSTLEILATALWKNQDETLENFARTGKTDDPRSIKCIRMNAELMLGCYSAGLSIPDDLPESIKKQIVRQ